jgi:hypothetical protein
LNPLTLGALPPILFSPWERLTGLTALPVCTSMFDVFSFLFSLAPCTLADMRENPRMRRRAWGHAVQDMHACGTVGINQTNDHEL